MPMRDPGAEEYEGLPEDDTWSCLLASTHTHVHTHPSPHIRTYMYTPQTCTLPRGDQTQRLQLAVGADGASYLTVGGVERKACSVWALSCPGEQNTEGHLAKRSGATGLNSTWAVWVWSHVNVRNYFLGQETTSLDTETFCRHSKQPQSRRGY